MLQKPHVAIIGRSNVGKSTLFNKIAEQRHALVHPVAGTTRDRLETEVSWRGTYFVLVDTGGLDPHKNDPYYDLIIKQSRIAQKEAAVLLVVVDVTVGIVPEDDALIKHIRRLDRPAILVINKCDNPTRRAESSAFKKYALPRALVSAANGSGVGDLLDIITAHLPAKTEAPSKPHLTLALLGKPNVGKSSLVNALSGQERMIVSPLPHTTRDTQDIHIMHNHRAYTIIDTAGIRRSKKKSGAVEELSIEKSRAALERADVAALVLDIAHPLTSQDKRLAREIEDTKKGICIIANKWDQIPSKTTQTINEFERHIARTFPNLSWVPVLFTSATQGKRVRDIISLAEDINTNLHREISENALNKFLKKAVLKRKPTIGKGTKRPRLLSMRQVRTAPPMFRIGIPHRTTLASSYVQYLANALRDAFEFEGVPLSLHIERRASMPDESTAPIQRKRPTHRSRRIPKKNMRR